MTTAEPSRSVRSGGPTPDQLRRAVELSERLGRRPSRNAIMRELGVGAGVASKVLTELDGTNGQTQDTEAQDQAAPQDQPTATQHAPTEPDEEQPDALTRSDVSPGGQLDGTVSEDDGFERSASTATTDRMPDLRLAGWPLLVMALPAFVATWSGWVGLGQMTGFGPVRLLPGIADGFTLNTAITLPIGVEVYAVYALRAWLTTRPQSTRTRRFARWSALGSLLLGAAGQIAYHLLEMAGYQHAPWPVTLAVSCMPVIVLAMGAALRHMLATD